LLESKRSILMTYYNSDPKPPKKGKKKTQPLKRTAIKKKREVTGEGELFKKLISERPHVSFISGLPIENINYSNCMHVLSKKMFPKFRLHEKNIVFGTSYEHFLYDQGTEEQRQAYSNRVFTCVWKRLYDLQSELRKEYL